MTASSAELVAKADAAAMHFVTTELQTGLSFARMARRLREAKRVRPGNLEKARRYLDYARTAYEAASGRLGTVKTKPEQLREINLKMSELVELLGTDEKP